MATKYEINGLTVYYTVKRNLSQKILYTLSKKSYRLLIVIMIYKAMFDTHTKSPPDFVLIDITWHTCRIQWRDEITKIYNNIVLTLVPAACWQEYFTYEYY